MFVCPSSFHHTDRGANKNSGVCTAKLVNTVELQMAKRHTTKHPGLEQQEELGCEAIVADPELTEDHEEATEVHPGVGKLDRIVDGDAPGEVRKTLMCLRTLLSRRWQPHHVACLQTF